MVRIVEWWPIVFKFVRTSIVKNWLKFLLKNENHYLLKSISWKPNLTSIKKCDTHPTLILLDKYYIISSGCTNVVNFLILRSILIYITRFLIGAHQTLILWPMQLEYTNLGFFFSPPKWLGRYVFGTTQGINIKKLSKRMSIIINFIVKVIVIVVRVFDLHNETKGSSSSSCHWPKLTPFCWN